MRNFIYFESSSPPTHTLGSPNCPARGGGHGDTHNTPFGESQAKEPGETSEWDIVATSADCYKFACETGIITADELFLGDRTNVPAMNEDDEPASSQETGRATGTKRKSAADGGGSSSNVCGPTGSEDVNSASPPRVLRSLARIMERFGNFFGGFPFQSLTSEASDVSGGTGRCTADNAHRGTAAAVSMSVPSRPTPPSSAAPDLRPVIVDDPGLLPSDLAAARLSRAVFLRRGFTLLAECMSSSARKDEMAELLVAEGLWSRNMHLVLIYSLLWPWAGGLLPRGSDGDEVEKCESSVGKPTRVDMRGSVS